LQQNDYSFTRLTCVLLLHYLGETSQLRIKQPKLHITVAYILKKNIQFIHTTGLHL